MPTYEYHCDACEHEFEEFQMMSDEPLKKCPKCSKKKLRRLFGAGAAVIFKGSGFYETDYRSDSYRKAAKAEQDGGKSSSSDTSSTPTTDTSSTDSKGKEGKSSGKNSKSET